MKTLVIHPKDKTTKFLSDIYKDKNFEVITTGSSSLIRKSIMNNDRIIMLGHGCESGLLSRSKEGGDFDRYMISSKLVQILRQKECIGIWCNANLFAEKYNLKGLFSGMIISELDEAYNFNIDTTNGEINLENRCLSHILSYCLDKISLNQIPKKILEIMETKTELTEFNYNNFFYYD